MKYLVVVDMQNDFIDGVLGTKEALEIVPNVIRKIQNFDGDVLFTQDTHTENYMNTQEGKNLPVPHCVKGTKGWDLSPEIAKFRDERGAPTFLKPSFGSVGLPAYIRDRQDAESIELVGLCTDVCVIMNAMILKANFTEVPVTVDASCCAGITPEGHQTALSAMKSCQIHITGENE